ncbi:type II toxin-antitoxin system RelE/ParE family toxin [Enterobacter pasteurii]|uniref:type II toxin-antitoxin system RelE/ParE family toxin n=1 Tax=Enterobacter pasteurii TaxID=3029761 RepID=UPI0011DDCB8D|nr:type II toxin-antitoxin system RelE/ParE family toxin [Enterobacter pasteurii]ELK6541662.1 type II toxin-antitoxin system RelE/ParE family toxin [Enterobacter bugandensis]
MSVVPSECRKHRAELGEDICSLPVVQHMFCFVPSHSVITIMRILSQSQGTAWHEPENKRESN